MQIKRWTDGSVIGDFPGATLGEAATAAAKSRADLSWASLSGANLSRSDLSRADLLGSNLLGSNLSRANLSGSNLLGSNLLCADLSGATWSDDTIWPSPTMLLLALWGNVSPALCRELMRYDAANHPVGAKAFTAWAKKGGACPYADCRWGRAANFHEAKDHWSPGPAKSALWLAQQLLKEKLVKV